MTLKGACWDGLKEILCQPPMIKNTKFVGNGKEDYVLICCCFSFAQSCPTLWDPLDCSMTDFPVHHQFMSLHRLMSIKLVMSSNLLILCCPLLLLPLIFPSIRVFSNESVIHIRWPKYWSFSFSISPSNDYTMNKMSILPKIIHRLSAIPFKIAIAILGFPG